MIRPPPKSTPFPYTTLFRSILRNQAADLYFRQLGDRVGIGSYGHRPMPARLSDVDGREVTATSMPSMLPFRSEEHTSELQSRQYLVCRLLLEKKNKILYLTF